MGSRRPDPFLGIAGPFLIGQGSLQGRDALRVQIDVFGKLLVPRYETLETRLGLVRPELLDRLARVAVDFALHGAGGLVDHVHRRLLSAGIATLVAKLRAQPAATIVGSATVVPPTTIEPLIVEEPNFFQVRADAVGNFLAQPSVERVNVDRVF